MTGLSENPVSGIAVMYKDEELARITRKVFAVNNTLCALYRCKAYKILHLPPRGLCIDLHKSVPLR